MWFALLTFRLPSSLAQVAATAHHKGVLEIHITTGLACAHVSGDLGGSDMRIDMIHNNIIHM